MHGSHGHEDEDEGENSTKPRDVYTSPKERRHIDFAELKGPFRLELRLNAHMFPLVGLDLPLLSHSFFLCVSLHAIAIPPLSADDEMKHAMQRNGKGKERPQGIEVESFMSYSHCMHASVSACFYLLGLPTTEDSVVMSECVHAVKLRDISKGKRIMRRGFMVLLFLFWESWFHINMVHHCNFERYVHIYVL
ncbi:unnamed protein product [Sphenostylis stenocarpa]|uniref:Uncharacterized protein n=1 Tax=Sphenostylis stenocarpa TaxID=92480 RepID=A0AA86W300_9FABA|nr:unnamed protein product [Sphenostylis stenocarpa]CAJ1977532.1 unnamed protein product [Sphenostylis stenocarpa]